MCRAPLHQERGAQALLCGDDLAGRRTFRTIARPRPTAALVTWRSTDQLATSPLLALWSGVYDPTVFFVGRIDG